MLLTYGNIPIIVKANPADKNNFYCIRLRVADLISLWISISNTEQTHEQEKERTETSEERPGVD